MDKREAPREQPLKWALGALLLVGALARSWAYARRGALWTDEAGLALNFVGRELELIARPFVYDQYAPYLYLLGDKLIALTLGASEYALRFGSLLGGMLLLPCVAWLAARVFDRRAALFALAILVLNWVTIQYSSELKPYILDAVVSAVLAALTVPVVRGDERGHGERTTNRRELIVLAAFGTLAPWLSLPSIFMLAACGATLVLDWWLRRREARQLWLRCGIGALWLVSFGTHFALFLNAQSNSAYLQSYWAAADAFGPFPLHSLADVRWYFAKFFYLFNVLISPGPFGLRYVAALTWLGGLYLLWREQRPLVALFALPVALLFIASAVHKYIIADRMVLFLSPLLVVPIAVALAELARRARGQQLLAAGLATAFCLAPSGELWGKLAALEPDGPDIRTAIEHLQREFQSGDVLYVETQVEWIYAFYARREAFKAPFTLTDAIHQPDAALAQLDALRGSPRVWALLPCLTRTHAPNPRAVAFIAKAEGLVTHRLDEVGHKVAAVDAGNTCLFLYDLSLRAASQ